MTISIIRILPALAVTAFAAAACSSGEAAERWSVSNSQIGPVTARTAFDRDTLAGLLPGFDVAEAEAWSEGMAHPVIEARRSTGGPRAWCTTAYCRSETGAPMQQSGSIWMVPRTASTATS